jgi:hypothetical protein
VRSIILDSNLLLLLAIGLWNPRAIRTQKRLSNFSVADFELLKNFLGHFQNILTTAHILAEVSNLAGAATGQTKDAIFLQLQSLFVSLDERRESASILCSLPEFRMFGITDAAISLLSAEILLLTEDGRLAHHLRLKGLRAWTLEQVRALRDQANSA